MKMFVTADTHFGHYAPATKYRSRPEDYEDRIVRHWNMMVLSDDAIIRLGDVLVGKTREWSSIIPKLTGRKILVLGNHDTGGWFIWTSRFERN